LLPATLLVPARPPAEFSFRSMKFNAEGNVAVYDHAFAAQIKAVFEAHVPRCQQITLEQWKTRSLCERIRECYCGLYKDLF
jgi:hypothetical protein